MFEVSGVQGDMGALFPPAKITDVNVEEQISKVSYELSWTAPGESLDEGTGKFSVFKILLFTL